MTVAPGPPAAGNPSPSSESAPTPPRVTALDGLRGIAALVVFIEHFMLTIPVFSDVFMQATTDNPANLTPASLAWWLSYTPLHIIWQGTSAVYIFFILSGYVLTLPAIRMLSRSQPGTLITAEQAATYRLRGYYIRRLLRLYLPVWGAIVTALALMTLVPRTNINPTASLSSWVIQRAEADISPFTIAQDATLILGAGETVSPLWTLQWEVIFSLLLPLYIVLALTLRRHSLALAVAAFALVTLGAISGIAEAVFLPMFLLGVILATAQDRLTANTTANSTANTTPQSGLSNKAGLASRLTPLTRLALFLAATVLITSRWSLLGLTFIAESYQLTVTTTLLGSAIFVFLALHSPLMSRMLSVRPLITLGRFSFSLYLVHEPVVVSLALLFPGEHLTVAVLALAAVAAFTIAFYYLVERPSQNLGRYLDRRFSR